MRRTTLLSIVVLLSSLASAPGGEEGTTAPGGALDVRHVTVYHEPGMFGGWPANHGIWSWDNEILVGFTKGYYQDLGDRIVAVYYFTDAKTGPERYIGATIWNPPGR